MLQEQEHDIEILSDSLNNINEQANTIHNTIINQAKELHNLGIKTDITSDNMGSINNRVKILNKPENRSYLVIFVLIVISLSLLFVIIYT